MLGRMDRMIILQRRDQPIADQWLEALDAHQLADRVTALVTAVVTSDDPDGDPSLVQTADADHWCGSATGLDRRHAPSTLRTSMRPALEKLWTRLSVA